MRISNELHVGVEPTTFCLEGRRAIHCANGALELFVRNEQTLCSYYKSIFSL